MKKLILSAIILISGLSANAQNCFWHENFDAPSLGDSVTTIFNGTHGFALNSRLSVSPANSDSAFIGTGDFIELRTNCMDLTGNTFVLLNFDHICKVDFFDVAIIEVSTDCGVSWTQLTGAEYITPPPNAPFQAQNNQFSAGSYGTWQPANPNAIPDNSWWKHEIFDISSIVAADPSQVMIRWFMWDSNTPGGNNNAGWSIDNICVTAAPCELTVPSITQLPPVLQNTVYNLGPYTLNATITDNSGISAAYLVYSINSVVDSVLMTFTGGNNYQGIIPAVNDGDIVCYYFSAFDASACLNYNKFPASGCTQFTASQGITFPYCDNFDAQNLWSDSTTTGSPWQLGTPAFGATTGAHSAPNAWDVQLTSAYSANANAFLYSPVFSVPGGTLANAKLSFWLNYNTETNWDGTRLEYSSDGGSTWFLLGDFANSCGCQTNWYNLALINSSGQPAWAGNSGGWKKSEFVFGPTFIVPQIQFRFIFTSDASIQVDGVSLDDLCIILPQPIDAGVAAINQPLGNAPAGSCQDVTVTIQNHGLNTITSLDIYYSDGTTVYGPFPWTGNLAAGQTAQVLLPCFTVPSGGFNLCSWTVLTGDGFSGNDTTCINMVGVPVIVVNGTTGPYCDNFDGANNGWSNLNNGGAAGTDWQLGTPNFGLTNTPFTVPNAWDINLTSSYQNDADVALYSPYFDLTTAINPYLNFYVNFNTEQSWDGVRLEFSVNGGPWTLLGDSPGNTVNWYNMPTIFSSGQPAWAGNSAAVLQNPLAGGWCNVQHNALSAMGVGGNTQFRFVFTSDASVIVDGFSIDNFCLGMPAPWDAGVPTINSPVSSGGAGTCQPVVVTIKNFGINTLTSLDIYYAAAGNTYGPFPWTGSLAPGNTTQVTLPCFTLPSGGFTLCAWTVLANDGNIFNDTSCVNLTGVPVIPLSFTSSYCDDFESGNVGWSVVNSGNASSTWQLGTPTVGIGTPNSGVNCWDINLNSLYGNDADVALYSPIFDLTNALDTKLSFYLNYTTETSFDGTRLEYTTNGSTWNLLGTLAAPNPPYLNWYTNTIISSNQPAWAGTTGGGWIKSEMQNLGLLPGVNGSPTFQLRFIFTSDASVVVTGGTFGMDDFCMEVPVPLTASPVTIGDNIPFPLIFTGQSVSFNADLRNKGTIAINTLDASLFIDQNLVVTDSKNYSPALAPGAQQNHTFSVPWTATAGLHDVCVVTSNPNGSADQNPTDDTICYQVQVLDTIGITSANPYCNNFDGAQPEWATFNAINYNNNSSWEQGTPNQSLLSAAHSAPNAWMTKLDVNYPDRDTSGLFTPAFNVKAGKTYKISFWHQISSEFFQDGGTVDYSTDLGASWQNLGYYDPTNNWYNSLFITALDALPPLPGWSGFFANYEFASRDMCFTQDQSVLFRFRFASDFSTNYEGWAIDDFCFEETGTCPTGISETSPDDALSLSQNYPNPSNGTTYITYSIPSRGHVKFEIRDILGQTVKLLSDEEQNAGLHALVFQTEVLKPGIYLYSLTFESQTLVRKMVITR